MHTTCLNIDLHRSVDLFVTLACGQPPREGNAVVLLDPAVVGRQVLDRPDLSNTNFLHVPSRIRPAVVMTDTDLRQPSVVRKFEIEDVSATLLEIAACTVHQQLST